MLRSAVLLVVIGVCVADWELYKSQFGKRYTEPENNARRAIFEANLRKINEHNSYYDEGRTSYRMGLNQYTDMTAAEIAKYRGLKIDVNNYVRNGTVFDGSKSVGVPISIDWRKEGYVTPVKDQGFCGACWAFSTTGSIEGQHFAKTGKLVSLSEQNLVDCSGPYGNSGCEGGYMNNAFKYVIKNKGIDTEKAYPYIALNDECQFNRATVGATVTGYVDIPRGDEQALRKAVGTVGPVSIAIDASNESFHLYKDGVYDEPSCSSTYLDHGVLIVGYGTENGKDYWLIKNSWNQTWGEEGYIKMARNSNNQCGVASMASYPTV